MKHITIPSVQWRVVPQPSGNILSFTELDLFGNPVNVYSIPMDGEASKKLGKALIAPRVALPPGNGQPSQN